MNRSAQHTFEPEEIMAYLDGELEPQRASALAAHLDHCAECRAVSAGLRRVSDQLAAWEVDATPERLSANVLKAARENAFRKSPAAGVRAIKPTLGRFDAVRNWLRPRPWAWALSGAVATVLFLTLTVSVLRYRGDHGIASSHAVGYKTWLETGSGNVPGDGTLGKLEVKKEAKSRAPAPPPITDQRSRVAPDSNGLTHGIGDHAENAFNVDGQASSDQASTFQQAPMIARTAALSIVAKDFAPVENTVKDIVARHHGYIGELNTSSPKDAARNLNATLRIPAPQLDGALAELKQLGRVEQESQSGEEVSKQYTDLVVRLKNSQVTEQRLVEVLRTKTGKVHDILEVEREIARVRGEIEQMESDRRTLKTRVDYATVQLNVNEDFRASLQVAPPSTATRLHNAVVQGYHDVVESLIGFAVWLLAAGPTLLLWAAVLFFPARLGWKRWKHAKAAKISTAGAA